MAWHEKCPLAQSLKYRFLHQRDPRASAGSFPIFGQQGYYAKGRVWRGKGSSRNLTPYQYICDKTRRETTVEALTGPQKVYKRKALGRRHFFLTARGQPSIPGTQQAGQVGGCVTPVVAWGGGAPHLM